LPKPLAVIHRSTSSLHRNAMIAPSDEVRSNSGSDSMDIDEQIDGTRDKATSWDMVAIVKRKIVFSKRPMPITTLRT